MPELISKAELSRRAGVSRMAVTKATAEGGRLADAMSGGKVDASHALVVEWLTTHSGKPPKSASAPKKRRRKAKTDDPPPATDLPTQIGNIDTSELEGLTLREIVMRYGTIDGFKRFVETLKQIGDYKLKELNMQTKRGDLIQRDKVAGSVFPVIEVAFGRLVNDVPVALVPELIARVESGGDDTAEDVRRLIHDANARVLKSAKSSLSRLDILADG